MDGSFSCFQEYAWLFAKISSCLPHPPPPPHPPLHILPLLPNDSLEVSSQVREVVMAVCPLLCDAAASDL